MGATFVASWDVSENSDLVEQFISVTGSALTSIQFTDCDRIDTDDDDDNDEYYLVPVNILKSVAGRWRRKLTSLTQKGLRLLELKQWLNIPCS